MTLILGANLSDRLILAADTKLTKLVGENNHKLVGYSTKLVQYSNKDHNGFIACMYAGNKRFAFFLHTKLSVAFENGELSTDINDLQESVETFFKKNVPKYGKGEKSCKIIFAGVSYNSIKHFSFNRFSDLLGPEAGHIDDEGIASSLPFAHSKRDWNPVMDQGGLNFLWDQKIFSFEINEDKNIFGVGKIGKTYSVVSSFTKDKEKRIEDNLLRYFLNKRDILAEAENIINYIRNNFSDTIGGAITLGYIDREGKLIYVGYNIEKSGKFSDRNWSFKIENGKMIAMGPAGEKIDLAESFFDSEGNSNWYL